ncbi:hypothetical protein CBW46_002560 [Paenibacillus xerothermodurans]|uniref:Uncharacterized protein n=2 Tax=Paenibacillus xerothermodurans TaxID=1977292 RepID=A0A2W1ND89_PAEXE|nr:hypothetical protein CBW46_002560 [Paenibacillus xerothermodurans]
MRPLSRTACLILCCCIGFIPCRIAAAENSDQTKSLLQKSLTIYEVDQELIRISGQETALMRRLADTEQQLAQQQHLLAQAKEHADKVLRAYYMGDRDSLWMLLFSTSSFSDALTAFDYLQMIVRNDHIALQRHTASQQQLQELTASLSASHMQLQNTKERYIAHRQQLVTLQKQVDEQLDSEPDAQEVLLQMADLTLLWREKGVPLFNTYFNALAHAMTQLPELISDTESAQGNHLIINGFEYTFQITDEQLNTFLRTKNPLFRNMTFRFTDTHVITGGTHDGMDLMVKGKYELADDEALSGKSYVRFAVEQLQFNGYDLPASTIAAMAKDFDLGIYPHKLASFLIVTGIRMEEGKLSLMLKLAL